MTRTPQPNTPKRSLARRVLRWALVVVALLLLVDFVGLPMLTGIVAAWPAGVWPADASVGDSPPGFSARDLTTEDGVRLAAWYAPPQNGAAIILLAGAGGDRDDVRDKAIMLAAHGYGVLAPDLRGAGESGGNTNRFGWNGTRDVGAAVAFLAAQDDVGAIGGWGFSLGGEVLLGAASTYPALGAIVSDGATCRSHDEKIVVDSYASGLPRFHSWLTYTFVGLFTGDDPPDPPLLDSLRDAGGTQILLIAAGKDDDEIAFNALFRDTLGDRGELWIVPGVGHTGGYARYTDEYTRRVLDFFAETLLASDTQG